MLKRVRRAREEKRRERGRWASEDKAETQTDGVSRPAGRSTSVQPKETVPHRAAFRRDEYGSRQIQNILCTSAVFPFLYDSHKHSHLPEVIMASQ